MGGRGREGQGRGGEGGKEKGGEGRRERNRSSTFWVKFTPLKVKKAIPQKECIYRRGAHLPHVGRLSPLYTTIVWDKWPVRRETYGYLNIFKACLSWYSLRLPTVGWWLVTYWDSLLSRRRSPIQALNLPGPASSDVDRNHAFYDDSCVDVVATNKRRNKVNPLESRSNRATSNNMKLKHTGLVQGHLHSAHSVARSLHRRTSQLRRSSQIGQRAT